MTTDLSVRILRSRASTRSMANDIDRLDKKAGTLSVLVALDVAGELRMTELCRGIPLERETVTNAVRPLEDIDLVEIRDGRQFPFSKSVSLSPLGRKLVHSPLMEWPSVLFEHGLDRVSQARDVSRARTLEDRVSISRVEARGLSAGERNRSPDSGSESVEWVSPQEELKLPPRALLRTRSESF